MFRGIQKNKKIIKNGFAVISVLICSSFFLSMKPNVFFIFIITVGEFDEILLVLVHHSIT